MNKFFATVLVVFIGLVATTLELSAGRRPPTPSEQATYLPLVQMWLGVNWEQKKDLGDGVHIAQKITEVTYCCLDEDENGHVHIIDVRFHAKYYDHNRLIEEKDMAQRVLFKCADGRIVDWDASPAYKLEEVT